MDAVARSGGGSADELARLDRTDRAGRRQVHEAATGSLEERIQHHFPVLFITLLSVLIGLVLADLVSEARKMVLWPLDPTTLRTWGQLMGHCASALTAWVVYSHIGISRERVPVLADSVIAFIVPMTLLLAMPLIGKDEVWPYFYFGAFSLAVCVITSAWLLHLSREEPELASLSRLLWRRGFFMVFYVGIPIYLAAGWLGQHGQLPSVLTIVFSLTPAPAALLAAHLFSRDWREAIRRTPGG